MATQTSYEHYLENEMKRWSVDTIPDFIEALNLVKKDLVDHPEKIRESSETLCPALQKFQLELAEVIDKVIMLDYDLRKIAKLNPPNQISRNGTGKSKN